MTKELNHTATIESVLKALDVLFYIADCGAADVGVTEVSDALGMPKAVAYRMLTTLRVRGLVEIDSTSHRYVLTSRVLQLGEAYQSRADVREICRIEMTALVIEAQETATLSVRHGFTRSYIDQISPDRDGIVTVTIGKSFPFYAGATSKAFFAFMSKEEQEEWIGSALSRFNPDTIVSKSEFYKDLEAIRHRGYAFTVGERNPNAAAVAAPVYRFGETSPVAVMSLFGPRTRLIVDVDRLAALLVASARRASMKLGYEFN